MKNETITNFLKLELYSKGGSTCYCDYYFYNGISNKQGTKRAAGYGYDKHSTTASEAINEFKFLYRLKNGIKWDGSEHSETKQGHRIYGLYKDKHISYGIGLSSVLNCLTAFSNVKITSIHYGNREDFISLEIKTTKKQIEKEISKNQKIIDNKKSNKIDKKEAKETIKKIQELFEI